MSHCLPCDNNCAFIKGFRKNISLKLFPNPSGRVLAVIRALWLHMVCAAYLPFYFAEFFLSLFRYFWLFCKKQTLVIQYYITLFSINCFVAWTISAFVFLKFHEDFAQVLLHTAMYKTDLCRTFRPHTVCQNLLTGGVGEGLNLYIITYSDNRHTCSLPLQSYCWREVILCALSYKRMVSVQFCDGYTYW